MTDFDFKQIGYRFRGGAVRYNDLGYVLCIDPGLASEKLPHTAFYALDEGGWCMFDIGRWMRIRSALHNCQRNRR